MVYIQPRTPLLPNRWRAGICILGPGKTYIAISKCKVKNRRSIDAMTVRKLTGFNYKPRIFSIIKLDALRTDLSHNTMMLS